MKNDFLTLPQRIEAYLVENGSQWFIARDVALAIGAPHKEVTAVLQRMADSYRCKRMLNGKKVALYMIDTVSTVAEPARPRPFKPYKQDKRLTELTAEVRAYNERHPSHYGPGIKTIKD